VPHTIMTTIPLKGDVTQKLKGINRNIIWASLLVALVIIGGVIAVPRITELVGARYEPKDELSHSGSLNGRVESPAPNTAKPRFLSTDPIPSPTPNDQSGGNRLIQDHIKVARFLSDRGDYADALTELEKAKSVDPANRQVQLELERVLKICEAEMKILKHTDLKC